MDNFTFTLFISKNKTTIIQTALFLTNNLQILHILKMTQDLKKKEIKGDKTAL